MNEKKNLGGLIVFLVLLFVFLILPVTIIWMLFPSNRVITRMESYSERTETVVNLDSGSVISISEEMTLSLLKEIIPEYPTDKGFEEPIINLDFETDEIVIETLITLNPAKFENIETKRTKLIKLFFTITFTVKTERDGTPVISVKKAKIGRMPLPVRRLFSIVYKNFKEQIPEGFISEEGIHIKSWNELLQLGGEFPVDIKEIDVIKDRILVVVDIAEVTQQLEPLILSSMNLLGPLKSIITEDGDSESHKIMVDSINSISNIITKSNNTKSKTFVSYIYGDATLSNTDTADYMVDFGSEVKSNETISTSKDTTCEIIFYDNSRLRMLEETILNFVTFYEDNNTRNIQLELVKGTIVLDIKGQENSSNILVEGEYISASLTDSTIVLYKKKNKETIFVLKGSINLNDSTVLEENQYMVFGNNKMGEIEDISQKDYNNYSQLIDMYSSEAIMIALIEENYVLETVEPLLSFYDAYQNMEEDNKAVLTERFITYYEENRSQVDLLINESQNSFLQ